MKCAHLFTNERAPVADHAPCSWWSAVLAWSQRCMDGSVDKQRNKTNNIGSTHQIDGKIKWISVSGGQWKGCVVRTEDRALSICFVQDKRTVSRLFIKRLCYVVYNLIKAFLTPQILAHRLYTHCLGRHNRLSAINESELELVVKLRNRDDVPKLLIWPSTPSSLSIAN